MDACPTQIAGSQEKMFRLCLSHSPDTIPWARQQNIDLMLAGHVHGGQMRLPLFGSLFVPSRYSRRFDCGTFSEGSDRDARGQRAVGQASPEAELPAGGHPPGAAPRLSVQMAAYDPVANQLMRQARCRQVLIGLESPDRTALEGNRFSMNSGG